jgi:hypothetical protein
MKQDMTPSNETIVKWAKTRIMLPTSLELHEISTWHETLEHATSVEADCVRESSPGVGYMGS